jgi:long-chain acyl-CoA synthetase
MKMISVKKQYSGENIVDSFFKGAEQLDSHPLLWYRKDKAYTPISWTECTENVIKLASFLVAQGIKKGDTISIFSDNRWEWWIADLATLSIGAITVPVYSTNSAEETRYVLAHSGARLCFTGNTEQAGKVLSVKRKLPGLKKIISFDDKEIDGTMYFGDALSSGVSSKKGREVVKRIGAIKSSDTASILYTSGTTGNPKGVVLTHANFLSEMNQLAAVFGEYLGPEDRFLSFLPLSHALERGAGFYTAMHMRCQVAFAENFRTISADLAEIQPQVIVSVPRLYEKINAGISVAVAKMNPVKRAVVKWAIATGRKNISNHRKGESPSGWLARKLSFAEKNVLSVLKKEIGFADNKIAISGGGPLSYSDYEFFLSLGINLFEGYGLTEASPCTNVNPYKKIKLGTVGPAMFETKVRISDEGEILLKGPQVMSRYYKDPAATKEAFTKDGWFRTGDLGVLDEDGYLTITGRIKDIIVTAGGKNISPQNIESTLLHSKYIENIAIIGDRRKFLTALVIPAFHELELWAHAQGILDSGRKELLENVQVKKFYTEELGRLLGDVARVEQVKRFTLLSDVWSIETGELTPTLKVKRRVIEKKYADVIDAMYAE